MVSLSVGTLLRLRPLRQLEHPREAIRQFTPNWFAVTMGTGILALALPQLPLPGMQALGQALWLFNIALFCLFSLMYAARWVFFFHEAKQVFGHATVSMFFGTIPMGLATIINGVLVFGVPLWGEQVVALAFNLWWLDVVLALACGVSIPYLMFTHQEHSIDRCGGSRSRQWWFVGPLPERRPGLPRVNYQLRALGLFGAGGVEYSGDFAAAHGST